MATCLVGNSMRSLLLVLQDRSGPKGLAPSVACRQ